MAVTAAPVGVGAENALLAALPEDVRETLLQGAEVEVAPTEEGAGQRPGEPVEFGPWLRARLHSQGLSQERAARRLGVSTRTVGRWVRGDTQPRFRDLGRLREAFGPLPEG